MLKFKSSLGRGLILSFNVASDVDAEFLTRRAAHIENAIQIRRRLGSAGFTPQYFLTLVCGLCEGHLCVGSDKISEAWPTCD